jgi:hypothetical protein
VFGAGFSDYEATLNRRGSDDPPERERAGAETGGRAKEPPRAAADAGSGAPADEHKARRAASRELEKKKKRAERLEGEIADSEKELFALRDQLRQAPGDDWEKLHVLSQKEQALKKKVDSLMSEWERLSIEVVTLDEKGETR